MTRPAPIGLALLVALSAYCHSGCGSKHRPAVLPPPHVAPIEPPPPPAETAAEVTARHEREGGQLARDHAKLVGVGSYPVEEPWAPPGRWLTMRAAEGGTCEVWVPNFARHLETLLAVEVETTLPRHDRLYSTEPHWAGLKPGSRLVILPGAFQLRADSSAWVLAAGLCAMDNWHEPAPAGRPIHEGVDRDVLYVAWRPQASGPYLPALAHELAHSWSRSWLGEGPPGTREVRR